MGSLIMEIRWMRFLSIFLLGLSKSMNIRTSILYLCITFSVFFTNQDAYAKKVSFEGWFVQPDIAGILPIWVELEVSNNGNIQGWFCYRIDGEKVYCRAQ